MRGSAAVLKRTLGNGRLRRVALAFAGFSLAESGVWTAILVYAYQRGGTTAAGVIAVIQLVPAALVAAPAAAVAERRGGAFALVAGYLLRSMTMAGAAAVILAGGPAPAAYALAVGAASAVTLSRPAQAKVLSSLVELPDELTAATAVSSWIESSSALAGPALAGIIIALDGPGAVFAVFAAAVAGSTLLVAPLSTVRDAGLPTPRRRRAASWRDCGSCAVSLRRGRWYWSSPPSTLPSAPSTSWWWFWPSRRSVWARRAPAI